MYKVCVFITLFLSLDSSFSQNIFNVFKKCQISDEECLRTTIQQGLHKLAEGSKELDIPPLDPYNFGNASYETPEFYQNYTDLTFFGFTNTVVKSIRINLEESNIDFELFFPTLHFETTYFWKGKVDDYDIDAHAYGIMKCVNTTMKSIQKVQKVRKGDGEYLDVTEVKARLIWGKVAFNLGNVRDKDQEFNKYINTHPEGELKILQPLAEQNVDVFIKFVMNKVFSNIPFTQLFLSK